MILQRDSFDDPIVPDYILCKANGERIGNILCTSKTYDKKFNDISEIQFITYLNINNEKNQIYDAITEMKYIEVSEIGFFAISSVRINSEGTEYESKTVIAKSYECLLAQKYLDTFTINYGTTESLDGVTFYNLADKSKSLLHLVLEKCPDWTIGHIDASLMTLQRSFEVSRQDVYSFITTDIAEAFECFFIFDTFNKTINVYAEKNYGYDTNIHVSYNNLLKSTDISCSTDDIKTCLTITGYDDLSVREVNMGYDKIYNFDYYNSTEYMSQELYESFNMWKNLRESKLADYTALLSQYQNYYIQINELTYTKMPSTSGSTIWTEYGLVPLQQQLSAYEQQQAVSMKAGHGETSSPYYQSEYLPIYNTIQTINSQLSILQEQINALKHEQASILSQMETITNLVSMKNNFSEEQLKELSAFIREDELSSDNFVVTDVMTDEERFDILHQMLEYGQEELNKAATPQLSFSTDMNNIFIIPDFDIYSSDFDVGNYIWVTLRDNYSVKAKILNIHINYYDASDFSLTFGNIVRKANNIFTNIQDAINKAHSAATSVSFKSSYWSQSAKDTSNINQMLADGLLSAGNYLKSGDDSELFVDSRGIFVNTTSGKYAGKDSIFLGGGKILFTDDNWKTVAMAVGRADVHGESRFGVFADFCIASYIAGSTIEASNMTASTIKASNMTASTIEASNMTASTITATDFNNGNGTFHVDSNGNLVANSATIKGVVKADSGYIGGENGFTILNGKLYSGNKSSFSSSAAGVYIGIDGIKLGNSFSADSNGYIVSTSGKIGGFDITSTYISNGTSSLAGAPNSVYLGTNGISLGTTFSVTNAGVLTVTSGTVGGWTLNSTKLSAPGIDINSAGYIMATNGNWRINADGSATFENVYISGVQNGSNFGNVSQTDDGTYGNFDNGFNADTSFGLTGGALINFNDLVANKVTAAYIDATVQLSANYATIYSLDAAKARISSIESNYISASEVSANYATMHSLEAVKAKFNELNADNIITGKLSADRIDMDGVMDALNGGTILASGLGVTTAFSVYGTHVTWKSITINGTSYNILIAGE